MCKATIAVIARDEASKDNEGKNFHKSGCTTNLVLRYIAELRTSIRNKETQSQRPLSPHKSLRVKVAPTKKVCFQAWIPSLMCSR